MLENLWLKNRVKLRAVLLIFALLFTSGCGFQLARPLALNDELQPVLLNARDPLAVTLKRTLQSRGVKVLDSAFERNAGSETNAAKTRLALRNIDREKRNYSVNFSGKNAEFLLSLKADVIWSELPGEESVVAKELFKKTIEVETVILANPSNPGAERSEIRATERLLEQRFCENILLLMSGVINQ